MYVPIVCTLSVGLRNEVSINVRTWYKTYVKDTMKITMNKNENGGSDTDSIMAQEDAEEGHFCWDKSKEEVVGKEKEAEKEDGKGKWQKVDTASKRKATTEKWGANNATPPKQSRTMVMVQTNATTTKKSVAALMKERGESYVDDKSVMKTPVEVQWVLNLGSTTFNVQTALLMLLTSMATVDDTIYLKTGETKEMVRDPADLPTAKEFTEAFKVTQKEERNRPTRIKIYFTLMSKTRLNTFKFDSYVWSYIQKTNVYIKQDNFQRNAVVSPGSIINAHPTLV